MSPVDRLVGLLPFLTEWPGFSEGFGSRDVSGRHDGLSAQGYGAR